MRTSKEIAEIIKNRREELGISQRQLARIAGTNNSSISRYESGITDFPINDAPAFAKALNLDLSYLLGVGEEFDDNLVMVDYPKYKIPLLGTIKAGTPALAEENIEDYIELDKKIQADFALKVKGDSMINARIYENDIVFIRSQSDVEDGEIAVVLIEDEATLKRVYKMGGKVILRAENPAYSPIELDGEEEVRILGKATYKLSKVM